MFKLVVLLSAVALAAAKPSVLSPLALSSVHSAPVTVSQQSSSVVHPSSALLAAPAVYSAHVSPYAAVSPYAVASPYAAVAQAPLALSPHTPAVVLNAHGVPLDTADVVAARAVHYQAKALAGQGVHYLKKRSLAPYSAYSAVVAPAAVSHQSRVDVHSAPVVSYASAPVVSTYAAAPLAYSSPVAYGSPIGYASPYGYSSVLGANAYGVQPW